MLEYLHGGCELAKNLGAKLSSTQIPTRTEVLPNVQRFKDPATDAAVTKLASDADRESQKRDLEPLIETMMTPVPRHGPDLRSCPCHLPHRQGCRLAQREGPVRQSAGRQAPDAHASDCPEVTARTRRDGSSSRPGSAREAQMKYFARKFGFFLATLWAVVTLNFLIPRLQPGDPAETMVKRLAGKDAALDPAQVQAMRAMLGTPDGSMWQQYVTYLGELVHGNFGVSYTYYRTPSPR